MIFSFPSAHSSLDERNGGEVINHLPFKLNQIFHWNNFIVNVFS